MFEPLVVAIGRVTRWGARLRGGGSALPGLVVERLSPSFMSRTLEQLPHGVVLISGTNGKTTTTKIVADLLTAVGLRVFTNPTGSNFTRGVVAALLGAVDARGKLDADVAVLELDEAHAIRFIEQVQPRVSVLLNVLRDQLDRFGEIDTTAGLLAKVAEATSETVVLNRDDPRVAAIADGLPDGTQVRWFGFAPTLADHFPDDDRLHAESASGATEEVALVRPLPAADVSLAALEGQQALYAIDGVSYPVDLQLSGAHNALNAAAALAAARALDGESHPVTTPAVIDALAHVQAAFGRGEVIEIGGRPLRISLVKNPSGFRSSLRSPDSGEAVLIAINDDYADGRDMSWLWDVDFTALSDGGVSVVTGVRAWDMAVRLRYDEVSVGVVEPDLGTALGAFVDGNPDRPLRIFATYTAMLRLRRELARYATITRIGE